MRSIDGLVPFLAKPALSDRIAGTGFLLLGALSLIAERSTALTLPVIAVTFALLARFEAQTISLRPSTAATVQWLALTYAGLSALWALDPKDTLTHVGSALIMLASAQFIARWIADQSEARLQYLAFWLLFGFCCGLTYLMIELMSGQGIKELLIHSIFLPDGPNKMYAVDSHGNISIKKFEVNRNIAAANLLLWPALLCAFALLERTARYIASGFIIVVAILITTLSVHETSKIALPLSLGVFIVAYLRPRLAFWSVSACFLAAIIAVVPLSQQAYRGLHLDTASWLQPSAQDRIEIWGTLAERVVAAPVIGVGVRSTYAMNLEQQADEDTVVKSGAPKIPPHAHNVYLQIWFELGAIGALFLALWGGTFLSAVNKFPAKAFPFALSALFVGLVEVASSWDIWQRWFFGLLAISCVCVMLSGLLVAKGEERAGAANVRASG